MPYFIVVSDHKGNDVLLSDDPLCEEDAIDKAMLVSHTRPVSIYAGSDENDPDMEFVTSLCSLPSERVNQILAQYGVRI